MVDSHTTESPEDPGDDSSKRRRLIEVGVLGGCLASWALWHGVSQETLTDEVLFLQIYGFLRGLI